MKTGFVGAGFAASFHYESLIDGAGRLSDPIGVYSRSSESRERFAAAHGLRSFETLDALLEEVDVVHVCVPASLHEEVSVSALAKGVNVILEKPFTGYFGPKNDPDFRGNAFPKEKMRESAVASARRILDAERASVASLYYAENWVFAPAIQKETEILRKTGAQILWIVAEESHSGSHSVSYGDWRSAGGGSIMGKGTHPITAALYLKRVEGIAHGAAPFRPVAVTARTHEITRLPSYRDAGNLRTDYRDVEDFSIVHVVFEDGTIADVFATEIVMGGVHNWLEVFANNHRTRCNINPIDALETYNPKDDQLKDVYVVEKIGTKQGWTKPAPDENWMNGYVQELRSFYDLMSRGEASFSGAELGLDTVNVIYSAYMSAEQEGREVRLA
ncbi:MAG TPA: Gfo/Idh/MocA family oxidoreductase [Spirochaetia bacterium]|nr:Gfo/Idh/MocA family oxidoreductase [Spirochaetia bacterium]